LVLPAAYPLATSDALGCFHLTLLLGQKQLSALVNSYLWPWEAESVPNESYLYRKGIKSPLSAESIDSPEQLDERGAECQAACRPWNLGVPACHSISGQGQ